MEGVSGSFRSSGSVVFGRLLWMVFFRVFSWRLGASPTLKLKACEVLPKSWTRFDVPVVSVPESPLLFPEVSQHLTMFHIFPCEIYVQKGKCPPFNSTSEPRQHRPVQRAAGGNPEGQMRAPLVSQLSCNRLCFLSRNPNIWSRGHEVTRQSPQWRSYQICLIIPFMLSVFVQSGKLPW